uniref:Metalloproteinase inhibitor 3-like n=1 Tax=Crassostrea virginica TaxID=6565 RepID=A0A8B8BFS3_CRAVI|nr:metalloproteinase inhibitor 3-like [Crassostrea virginica]
MLGRALPWLCMLMCFMKLTWACSCYMPRYQNSFCTSEFAIKANVTSAELYFRDGRSLSSYVKESVIPGRHHRLEYNYSIDVLDVFKTTPAFETAENSYVTSDAFDGSCGIVLAVGIEYYMTGYIRNGHMVVASCFTTAPFSELKAGHLEGIQGLYADNCKCRVNELMLGKWRKKRVCLAEWYSPCEEQEAVCVKQKGGKCVWRHIAEEPCLLDEEE